MNSSNILHQLNEFQALYTFNYCKIQNVQASLSYEGENCEPESIIELGWQTLITRTLPKEIPICQNPWFVSLGVVRLKLKAVDSTFMQLGVFAFLGHMKFDHKQQNYILVCQSGGVAFHQRALM